MGCGCERCGRGTERTMGTTWNALADPEAETHAYISEKTANAELIKTCFEVGNGLRETGRRGGVGGWRDEGVGGGNSG